MWGENAFFGNNIPVPEYEPSPSKTRRKNSPEKEQNQDNCEVMVDNTEGFLSVLKKLYINKEMCDIYLKVGSTEHGAHRLILCAFSDVFQVMLTRPEWSEWTESRIELQEIPECEQYFALFLEYFYTGRIIITHNNVMPILALADKYIVKSLTKLCLEYMCHHVPHAALHNQLFSWYQYTMSCGHSEVALICQNYIKWNFEFVANTPDFSNFDPEMFANLLKHNDIVIYNEMVLYNCVAMWINLQRAKIKEQANGEHNDIRIKELIESVMRYIRFPMMSPRELADILLYPLVKEHKEFFMDRMSAGMSFHSGQNNLASKTIPEEEVKLLITPRLYTSDTYSTVLDIENYFSLPEYHPRTFLFSSHMSCAEFESDKVCEWVVDFYPKGMWFKKCLLILWQGSLEVPEETLYTVRLSLSCSHLAEPYMRCQVAVLLHGMTSGIEHVMEVKKKVHIFTHESKLMNFDNLIPFDLINSKREGFQSPYLLGPNRDKLKLSIVITPLGETYENCFDFSRI